MHTIAPVSIGGTTACFTFIKNIKTHLHTLASKVSSAMKKAFQHIVDFLSRVFSRKAPTPTPTPTPNPEAPNPEAPNPEAPNPEVKDNKNILECPICKDPLQGFEDPEEPRSILEIITTTCAHTFHKECLNGWLNHNNNCPMCRQDAPINFDAVKI